jgi:ATP-dependent DNA ligase
MRFDLIVLDGEDMRPHPWETRRATLAGVLPKTLPYSWTEQERLIGPSAQ